MAWYDEAVFYHIYPLGMTGAPKQNAYGEPEHRLNTLIPFIPEIKKMGFKRCMLPFDCLGSIDKCEGIELVSVRSLSDALQYIRHTVV